MDPSPPPLLIFQQNQNHPDSSVAAMVSSSPRYNEPQAQTQTQSTEALPNVPGSKLRLMCSYGGHIMPRPHDKSLSYTGGDTRIVAVDRHTSLKDLCSNLSRSLLHGRGPFTLKYHLPSEDLDNLITVSTDEDLQNMIDEYDRLASAKPSRLRVFLFFSKPETAVSMSTLLDGPNSSDTWFVDALNNSGILSRGVSDSAAADCCLLNNNNNQVVKHLLDVHSVPESPVEEENYISPSGSGSVSSSLLSCSIAYDLPPIRVRVDDDDGGSRVKQDQRLVVMEDPFGVKEAKQDDGFVASSSASADAVATTLVATGEDPKPLLPLQIVQQPRNGGGFGLHSPDSVASDSSIASANSFSKTVVYYQDPIQAAHVDNKGPTLPNNVKNEIPDNNGPGLQGEQLLQQVQDPGYTSPQQQHPQQQFVYIQHPVVGTGQVPMPTSYYPVYAPPSQQQQLHHHPIYVMPVGSAQPYNNMTLQSNIPQSAVASAATPSVYNPPVGVASNPSSFVQIPSNQFQQQYVALPQNIHHPPQPISMAPPATTNYGYDQYGGGPTTHDHQVYYAAAQQQQQATAPPPQYQSMTPAAAAAALSDVSKQFPIDNIQQPNRTSQPV